MNSKTNAKLEILAGRAVTFRKADFGDKQISIPLEWYDGHEFIQTLGLVVPAEKDVTATLTDEEGVECVSATLVFWEGVENDRGEERPVVCAKLMLKFADAVGFDRGKRFLQRYSRENDLAYQDPDRPDDRILTSAEREALEPQSSLTALVAELARENSATITFHGFADRGLATESYTVSNLRIAPELLYAKRSPWKVGKQDANSGTADRSVRIVLGTSREVKLIQSKLLVWSDKDCFMVQLDSDSLQRMLIERCANQPSSGGSV